MIVDSTHTNAMFHHISPREELIRQAQNLRKSIYKVDEDMHDKMPKKREASGLLEDQIEYIKELLEVVKKDGRFTKLPGIKEQIDYLEDKNAELKNNDNYGNASTCGKLGIIIQGATTLFLTNMKRIIKLNKERNKNIG